MSRLRDLVGAVVILWIVAVVILVMAVIAGAVVGVASIGYRIVVGP